MPSSSPSQTRCSRSCGTCGTCGTFSPAIEIPRARACAPARMYCVAKKVPQVPHGRCMCLVSKGLTCGTCHFCKVPRGSAKASRFRTLLDGNPVNVAIAVGRPVEQRFTPLGQREALAHKSPGQRAHL